MKVNTAFSFALAISLLSIQPAIAQSGSNATSDSYPTRPIRLVIAYSPGGGNDVLARLIAPRLSTILGQQIVIDNRPGAGGTIGATIVAGAQPDGYTVLMASLGTHGVAPSLYRNIAYDAIKDFEPIGLVAETPIVLVVNKTLPEVKSVQDLIKLSKSRPKEIRYASGGFGAPPHTAASIFEMMTGTKMLHVPYKGGGPAIVGLLAGETNIMFGPAATMLRQSKSGNVRALAISRSTRLPEYPDLPTFTEAGVPGYEANAWFGIVAPAKTPRPIINKWNKALMEVIQSSDFEKNIKKLGVEAVVSSPEGFSKYLRSQIAKYAKVIKATGMEAK